MSSDVPASERKIILLLAAVTFVNILDFMMVIPMGPLFAAALGIPSARLGIIGGSYTAAAAVAGLVGALFLDRFDRRSALAVTMLGLVTATAAGGFARNFGMLVGARVLAGTFGGPATSVALSILADVVPPQRRGKALGQVMGAFAAASVLGVPVGLELSRLHGWRTPFFAVAGLGLVVAAGAIFLMPSMRGHLTRKAEPAERRGLGAFLVDPTVLLSLAGTVAIYMGTFMLVPNLAAWVVQNLHLPAANLKWYYFFGGLVSFVAMHLGGRIIDRRGSLAVTIVGTVLMMSIVAMAFLRPQPLVPVTVVFMVFMVANSLRSVSLNTLSSRVPFAPERARFMSAQSAAQHSAAALGAMASSVLLANRPDGSLAGMDRLGLIALGLAATVPLFVALVTARLRRREAAAGPARALAR
jgi:predicted MFS family arabinose efflux permease